MEESKREEIREQAKKILNDFGKSLEKVKFKEKKKKDTKLSGVRDEKEGESGNKYFREQMFKNAPNKDQDYIITESKKW